MEKKAKPPVKLPKALMNYVKTSLLSADRTEYEDKTAQILADIQQNRNHSWYAELYQRNCGTLNDTALFYRGNRISYDKMFEEMRRYAKSLRALGLHEGCEIPVCLPNMPELVFLLGGISIIGAKVNIFGADFDHDYIAQIIDACDSTALFILDSTYVQLAEVIRASKFQNIVMVSLVDSLPNDTNPYEEYDKKHGRFQDIRAQLLDQDSRIISISDFAAGGSAYTDDPTASVDLDDEFIITYTSGSTSSGRPKAIVHPLRSVISLGRFMDPDVEKIPPTKNYTLLAHIPAHSYTDITAAVSDALMQGSILALEPIYDKDFYLDALLINQPTCALATRSFWVHTAKKVLYRPEYAGTTLPFLLAPFSGGEPLERNEELLLNRFLRKTKAGTGRISLPFSIVLMSVAGGDCEHGAMLFSLFRAIRSRARSNVRHGQVPGLMPAKLVDVAVLDSEGRPCKPYQLGRMVANSPGMMKEYKNDPAATAAFFIKDAAGKTWGDCKVYGYCDEQGRFHMKGRIPDHFEAVPLFRIAEEILKDRKHILSCEVVEAGGQLVAHVEFLTDLSAAEQAQLLAKAKARCDEAFGKDIPELLWRVHSSAESFPLTGCGKRNVKALAAEGTLNCINLA